MKIKLLKGLLLFSWIASAILLSLGMIAILEKTIEGFNYPLLSLIIIFFSVSLAVFTPYIFSIIFGGSFLDYHNKNVVLEEKIKHLMTEYEDTITLLRKIIRTLKEEDLKKEKQDLIESIAETKPCSNGGENKLIKNNK